MNDFGCRNRKNGVPAVDHHEVFQQFQKAKDSDQVGHQINSGKKLVGGMNVLIFPF